MMEDKNKILEQLKDAPPLWRYCNVINKEACFAGNQYKTPYTLQEVLEKDGNGVGFSWENIREVWPQLILMALDQILTSNIM